MAPIKTVAVFDLDGTLARRDTYLAFLLFALARRPARWPRVPLLSIAVALRYLGLRDNTWLKEVFLDGILGGLTRSVVSGMSERFVAKLLANGLRTNSREKIGSHKRAGDYLLLATASFDFYAQIIADELGFDGVVCTESMWSDRQVLQGRLMSGNCYGPVKRERVASHLAGEGCTWNLVAYTDSHADLPLLELSDRPVGVNPTRKLRQIALQRGFELQDWDAPDDQTSLAADKNNA